MNGDDTGQSRARLRVTPLLIRILAMASKETMHIRRDPQTLAMALGMPVALLLLFGFGVSFDLDHLPIGVVDEDRTSASRAFVSELGASHELLVAASAPTSVEGEAMLRAGDVDAVLVVPHGFGRHVARREEAQLQLLVDGSNGTVATQVISKADALAAGALPAVLHSALRLRAPVNVAVYLRYNPEARSALMIVPGLMAYILAMVAVLLTALAIAREWERGSMEQLFATPIGRMEIVVGKLLPYVALGGVGVLLVLAASAWVFDVPMRGSFWTLALAAVLFLFGMLGQGLLISTVTRSQMLATQAGTMSSVLPVMLLSGFLVPIVNMPWPLQIVANVLPGTHFIAVLRGVLLRSNGFAENWLHLLALAAFAAAMIGASTAAFRRRLD